LVFFRMLEKLAQPRNQALHRTKLATALAGIRGASLLPRFITTMPGTSHQGDLPPLTTSHTQLANQLESIVRELAGPLAGRNQFRPPLLARCEEFLTAQLAHTGLRVTRQEYNSHGERVANLEVELPGTTKRDEIIIIGAHYDAVELKPQFGLCPAANDNGSGVACTIALAHRAAARANAGKPHARTLRFTLWANEEPPFFWTEQMGSLVYAKAARARNDNIVGMLTPETIGCYLHHEGSQRYPLKPLFKPFFPSKGNFIAFMGMSEAKHLITQSVATFRERAAFPSIGAGLPAIIPHVGASDHWSFWRVGYHALMITDTAPYRYNFYHTNEDIPENMNFPDFARVTEGLDHVVTHLANVPTLTT
jgi:hypothetical protein